MPHHHEDEAVVDELLAQLRAGGHRTTTARRAVLEAIVGAGDAHLTADELADVAHRAHPEIHLSTVYRSLDALCDAGVLTRARIADRAGTYHLATDLHHHAVCSICGTTIQVPDDLFAEVTGALLSEHGFHAAPNHLTISGACARCWSESRAAEG